MFNAGFEKNLHIEDDRGQTFFKHQVKITKLQRQYCHLAAQT